MSRAAPYSDSYSYSLTPNLTPCPGPAAWLITSASLLPGGGQWLQGRRGAAAALFGMALLLALALIASIRLPASRACLLLMLLLVWYSVWDAARHAFPPSGADHSARWLRPVRLGLLSAALVLSALLSGYALLSRRFERLVINTRQYAPIFQPADELLVQRLAAPLARLRRGDVVIGAPGGAEPRDRALTLGWARCCGRRCGSTPRTCT